MTKEKAIRVIKDLMLKIEPPTDTQLGWLETWVTKDDIKGLQLAIEALKREERWIPVSERLPEDKEIVRITSSDMYLSKLNPWCGWKNGNNWYTFTANGSYLIKYPIAWMPLPKSYKESEEV